MSIELSKEKLPLSVENEQFILMTTKLSALLANEGIQIKPFIEGLPYFSKLTEEQKKQVNLQLSFYYELCMEQIEEGYTINDGHTFLWRALRKLGLIPRSDLFELLDNDSVIEIYSNENIQLFRNLNFFKYCSYTFEELHSREWWFNYERDNSITQKVFEYGAKFFDGELTENMQLNIPTHIVREINSHDLLVCEINFGIMGPLLRNKKPVAVIVTESARIIQN